MHFVVTMIILLFFTSRSSKLAGILIESYSAEQHRAPPSVPPAPLRQCLASYGLLIEFALFTLASQKLLYVASYDKDYPQNLKAKMEKRLPLPVAILLPQHASLAKAWIHTPYFD
jgi:hypothetical protein